MIQSFIIVLIGTFFVGVATYWRHYWLAAVFGMFILYIANFQMVVWLAGENSRDHSYYTKLVICRMTDKTGECP